MTITPHTAAAIAQTVIFAPAVPITSYLLIRNWKYRPRTAWYPQALFSAIRFAGGIMTTIEQQNPTRGIVIATLVLLNIGLIPLILSFLGYARLVMEHDFGTSRRVSTFLKSLKVCVLTAAGLLGAASGYAGRPEDADMQKALSVAAYIVFSVTLATLVATYIVLLVRQNLITPAHRYYIKWALVVAPVLCVRTAYGIIGVATGASGTNMFTSPWNPLFGNATAFGLMALLPEYICLCIYIYLSVYHLRTAERYEVVDRTKTRKGESIDMS